MNEAPKKIWRVEQNGYASGPDVLYIRADLVDGLVEALEEALELAKVWTNQRIFIQAVKPKIEAALKALEEE